MLKILIVEDDPQLAVAMSYLIEENVTYRVVGKSDDLDSAVSAAESYLPHLALVDLHLAGGSDGFSVAFRLSEMNIACLFITAYPPAFPLPALAVGCLTKPVTGDDLHLALGLVEDRLRGRESIRFKVPRNLELYNDHDGFLVKHRAELAIAPQLSAWLRFKLRMGRTIQTFLEKNLPPDDGKL